VKKELSAGIIPFRFTKNNNTIYLLLHYPQGHWGFPKGHVEEDETPLQAARRELKEETDLQVCNIHHDFKDKIDYYYSWEGEKRYKEVIFYAAEVEEKNVALSAEHQDFCWLETGKARDKITYEDEIKMFENWLKEQRRS